MLASAPWAANDDSNGVTITTAAPTWIQSTRWTLAAVMMSIGAVGCMPPLVSTHDEPVRVPVGKSYLVDGIRITLVWYDVVRRLFDTPAARAHQGKRRWVVAWWRVRNMTGTGAVIGYFRSNSGLDESQGMTISYAILGSTLDPHQTQAGSFAYEIRPGTRSLTLIYDAFGGTPEVTWKIDLSRSVQ